MTSRDFAAMGERMKTTWDAGTCDQTLWLAFLADLESRHLCVRQQSAGDDGIDLLLEEHRSTVDAFWALYRNDGSVTPLRRVGWRRTKDGWEKIACN